jgi:phage gpG-like protein
MPEGMSIHFEGLSEFQTSIANLVKATEAATKLAVVKAGNIVKKNAQTGLALRSHPKGTWSPSPPGDAPALVTGALRRSITVKVSSEGFAGAKAEIGPTIIYGRIQELGGSTGRNHSVRLPARPYMRPALEYSMPEMSRVYLEAWEAAFLTKVI